MAVDDAIFEKLAKAAPIDRQLNLGTHDMVLMRFYDRLSNYRGMAIVAEFAELPARTIHAHPWFIGESNVGGRWVTERAIAELKNFCTTLAHSLDPTFVVDEEVLKRIIKQQACRGVRVRATVTEVPIRSGHMFRKVTWSSIPQDDVDVILYRTEVLGDDISIATPEQCVELFARAEHYALTIDDAREADRWMRKAGQFLDRAEGKKRAPGEGRECFRCW